MDVFDDEILKLWRSLLKNKVMFIMIGGVATSLGNYSVYSWLDRFLS
jgi:hypothetical protein